MGNKRNTVMYMKDESSPGVSVTPTSSTDYMPINDDYSITYDREVLESAILSGNIGMKKPQLGIVEASGTFSTELRSSGTAGTAPDFNTPIKSCFGVERVSTADAVQAAPAPSVNEVWIATAGNIRKGEATIVQTAAGHSVRFVASTKINITVGVNDDIDWTDAGGVQTVALTAGQYTVEGSDTTAGSIAKIIKDQIETVSADTFSVVVDVPTQTMTISSDGSTLTLLCNTGANKATACWGDIGFDDATDKSGALTYTAEAPAYGTGLVFNVAADNLPVAADVVTAAVNYSVANTSHQSFTTGVYQGNEDYFEQIAGCLCDAMNLEIAVGQLNTLGWEVKGLSYARTATTASYTPSFQAVQGSVGLCVDMYIDSTAQDFNTFTLTVDNEVPDKLSAKECDGKLGNSVTQRSVAFTLNPYTGNNVTRYDELAALTDFAIFLTVGEKTGDNFDDGKTVALYLPQAMWTANSTSDIDENLIEELEGAAHTSTSGTLKEIYMSFL